MATSVEILLNGSRGRMGQAILHQAEHDPGIFISAACDVGDDPGKHMAGVAVIVDFSHHSVTPSLCDLALKHRAALVIGTTGHDADGLKRIKDTATSVTVVQSGNFSIGVNVLYALSEWAARALPPSYVAEVMEIHHRHKKDAPSGTALDLATRIATARGLPRSVIATGRSGETGARQEEEIGVQSLRGGEVIGEHTVFFFGDRERIELAHRASDRGIFADGAILAAKWAAQQGPGLFNMQDVLGLRAPLG